MSEHETPMVVVGLIVRNGRVFVGKRAKTKKVFPDKYELLGGHIDIGETPEQALKREIKEELGIDVEVGAVVGAFTFDFGGNFEIEIGYLCYPSGDSEPRLNPIDHSEGMWISEAEMYKLDKDDEEMGLIEKAFKMIKGGYVND